MCKSVGLTGLTSNQLSQNYRYNIFTVQFCCMIPELYRILDPFWGRKFDLLGISWKNRTDLCIVLKASLTFFSTSSELIAFNGSFIQLSCHRNQSETVIHKFRNGSNSFTSLDSFSYYNDKCRAATITSITHSAFCKRCHDNQAKLSSTLRVLFYRVTHLDQTLTRYYEFS